MSPGATRPWSDRASRTVRWGTSTWLGTARGELIAWVWSAAKDRGAGVGAGWSLISVVVRPRDDRPIEHRRPWPGLRARRGPPQARRLTGLGVAGGRRGGNLVVRRSGRYSSEDVHRALFPEEPPEPRTLKQIEAG